MVTLTFACLLKQSFCSAMVTLTSHAVNKLWRLNILDLTTENYIVHTIRS
jgi:hypothetical protein